MDSKMISNSRLSRPAYITKWYIGQSGSKAVGTPLLRSMPRIWICEHLCNLRINPLLFRIKSGDTEYLYHRLWWTLTVNRTPNLRNGGNLSAISLTFSSDSGSPWRVHHERLWKFFRVFGVFRGEFSSLFSCHRLCLSSGSKAVIRNTFITALQIYFIYVLEIKYSFTASISFEMEKVSV